MEYNEAYLTGLHLFVDRVAQAQNLLLLAGMGLGFALFVKPYLLKPVRFALCCGAGYAAFLFAFARLTDGIDVPSGISFLLRTGYGFFLLYLCERRNPVQKLFLSMTYYAISTLFVTMASDFNGLFADRAYTFPAWNQTPEGTVAVFLVVSILYLAIFGMALGLGVSLLNRAYLYKQEELSLRECAVLSVPSLSRLMQNLLYKHYYGMYAGYFKTLSDHGDEEGLRSLSWDSGIRLIDSLVFYLFLLAFVTLFFDMKRQYKEKLREAVQKAHITQMHARIRQTEQAYRKIYSLRHDMNHHIMVLQALLQARDAENALQYLERMGFALAQTRPAVATGHPVTDVILSEKQQEANERGIAFSSAFFFPAGCGIDAYDLSVLLGNALNNAIRAATEQSSANPQVTIRSVTRQTMYLIEIRNSFAGTWEIDGSSGFPVSTKPGAGHGFGLSNMQDIARRYHGEVQLTAEDGMAELTILLQTGELRYPLPGERAVSSVPAH